MSNLFKVFLWCPQVCSSRIQFQSGNVEHTSNIRIDDNLTSDDFSESVMVESWADGLRTVVQNIQIENIKIDSL